MGTEGWTLSASILESLLIALYHVWFSAKFRQEALQDERRDFILATFQQIAAVNEIELIETEAHVDHVHMWLRATDEADLSRKMMMLKGVSAREIFLREPELRLSMRTLVFWQKCFGRREVPEDQLENRPRLPQGSTRPPVPPLITDAINEPRIEAELVQISVPMIPETRLNHYDDFTAREYGLPPVESRPSD